MSNGTPAATMNLSIANPANSGAADDEIFVCVLGTDPGSNQFGYLDLSASPPVMVCPQPWAYVPGTTSRTLAQILTTFPSSIPVPAMTSARIYFAIGADFTAGQMSATSGPTASKTNPTLFDKVEFDTPAAGPGFINPTSVDFFGISYTVQATPVGATEPVTMGFDQTRQAVVDALWSIPQSPGGQQSGNLDIFRDCFVTFPTPSLAAGVLRVLSPKEMGLTDWGPATNVQRATQCSHFFDAYVNGPVFASGRQLTFYTKNYQPGQNNAANQIWAQVNDQANGDGPAMYLYVNAQMTEPYANVPVLGPPSAPWPLPDFTTPANYHNVLGSSADEIDWGFVLIGNAGAPEGNLPYAWASDPAAMALMISIDRGVAHVDDGITAWVDPANYYQGNGSGVSTGEMPILYYASVLHQLGLNGLAYALSYDDVYAQASGITFSGGGDVTVTLCDVGLATVPGPVA